MKNINQRYKVECEKCGLIKYYKIITAAENAGKKHYHGFYINITDLMARINRPQVYQYNAVGEYFSVLKWKRKKYTIGRLYKIIDGSGIHSGKTVKIIPWNKIRLNHRGIPDIPGYYKPPDFKSEIPIEFENKEVGLMYKERLIPID